MTLSKNPISDSIFLSSCLVEFWRATRIGVALCALTRVGTGVEDGDGERNEKVIGVFERILLRALILLESLILGVTEVGGIGLGAPLDNGIDLNGVLLLRPREMPLERERFLTTALASGDGGVAERKRELLRPEEPVRLLYAELERLTLSESSRDR